MPKVNTLALIEARKAKKKTQADLAKLLSIDQSAYSRKEKSGEFTDTEIEKITSYLKLSKGALAEKEKIAIEDLYKFTAEHLIKQESMLRVILQSVGELLADKKGVPVGTLLDKLTEAVNSQSLHQLEKLKP